MVIVCPFAELKKGRPSWCAFRSAKCTSPRHPGGRKPERVRSSAVQGPTSASDDGDTQYLQEHCRFSKSRFTKTPRAQREPFRSVPSRRRSALPRANPAEWSASSRHSVPLFRLCCRSHLCNVKRHRWRDRFHERGIRIGCRGLCGIFNSSPFSRFRAL